MSPHPLTSRLFLGTLALAAALAACDGGSIGDGVDDDCEDCGSARDEDPGDSDDEETGAGGEVGAGGGDPEETVSSGSASGSASGGAGGAGTGATGASSSATGGGAGSAGGGGGPLGDSVGPCTDCRVHVPPSYVPGAPAPLVVVLHGDEGRDYGVANATQGAIGLWSAAADARGFIVLALACPADHGCNGAWSDWLDSEQYRVSDANLAWLDAQVDAMEASYAIDTTSEYLTGYSGGAYWLGYVAPARASRFAGVAYVAGGMPAYQAYHGCPTCKIPGYFLGGDGDYRTEGQMSDTASAFDGCAQEIELQLVSGDHQQTIASLGAGRALDILDWFAARPLACP